MMNCLFSSPSAERIILRTGRDIEVSGKGCKALCQIASLRRCSEPLEEKDRRCRRCKDSRKEVTGRFWKNFPDISLDFRPRTTDGVMDDACRRCIANTDRTIRRLESDLRELMESWRTINDH